MKKYLVIAVVAFVLWICFINPLVNEIKYYDNYLETLESETEKIPAYVAFDRVYTPFGKVEIEDICKEQMPDMHFREVVYVDDSRIVFIGIEGSKQEYENWILGSLDVSKQKVDIQCIFRDAKERYAVSAVIDDFAEKNSYYYDGKIVLTDHKTVLEYEIQTQNSQIYPYEEYVHPNPVAIVEYVDDDVLKMYLPGDIVKTFTLQKMAEDSKQIRKLYELKDKKIWSGDSRVEDLLGFVQCIDGELYSVGKYYKFSGENYMVVLHYDLEKDSWRYVTNAFVYDLFDAFCYLVPVGSAD